MAASRFQQRRPDVECGFWGRVGHAFTGWITRVLKPIASPSKPRLPSCQTRSLPETAAELGLSEVTVRRLLARGKLRRLEDVGRVRITKASIDDYLRGTP